MTITANDIIVYLSRTWPGEVKARPGEPPQWAEAVKRFLTAA